MGDTRYYHHTIIVLLQTCPCLHLLDTLFGQAGLEPSGVTPTDRSGGCNHALWYVHILSLYNYERNVTPPARMRVLVFAWVQIVCFTGPMHAATVRSCREAMLHSCHVRQVNPST